MFSLRLVISASPNHWFWFVHDWTNYLAPRLNKIVEFHHGEKSFYFSSSFCFFVFLFFSASFLGKIQRQLPEWRRQFQWTGTRNSNFNHNVTLECHIPQRESYCWKIDLHDTYRGIIYETLMQMRLKCHLKRTPSHTKSAEETWQIYGPRRKIWCRVIVSLLSHGALHFLYKFPLKINSPPVSPLINGAMNHPFEVWAFPPQFICHLRRVE